MAMKFPLLAVGEVLMIPGMMLQKLLRFSPLRNWDRKKVKRDTLAFAILLEFYWNKNFRACGIGWW